MASRKTILFLQGPASPFLRHVADVVADGGATVRKIHFCLGDAVFWSGRQADWFRGSFDAWPDFIAGYLRRHDVTDIVMLGDGRDVHWVAIEAAQRGGVRIHILEHGYMRPDWLTLEPDGMSGRSRMPRDAATIRALAQGQPAPDSGPRYHGKFSTYALYDLAFHVPNIVLGPFVHPRYRRHGWVHPLVEWSGWIGKAIRRRSRRRHAVETIARLTGTGAAPFYLVPLQLPGDYQIRRYAPGGDLFAIVEAIVRSFAIHAPAATRLAFKIHPIDNGLSGWHRRLSAAGARHGIAGRIDLFDGGEAEPVARASAGVVTVNSTFGIAGLTVGRPVIALGSAVYDVPGLTHQGSLARFWTEPEWPDPTLVDAFLRALAATIQVRGGFIGEEAIRDGAQAIGAELLRAEPRLGARAARDLPPARGRYEAELLDPEYGLNAPGIDPVATR